MLVLWTACDLAGLAERASVPTGRWAGGDDRARLSVDLERRAGQLAGRFRAHIGRTGQEDLHYEGSLEGQVDPEGRIALRFGREDRPEERFEGVMIADGVAVTGTWLSTQGAFDLTLRPDEGA